MPELAEIHLLSKFLNKNYKDKTLKVLSLLILVNLRKKNLLD